MDTRTGQIYEATPQKNEHEWEAHGELHRVRWDFARDRWTAQTMLRGEWRYQWPSGSFDSVAAEIARLAGLVRPEES